MAKRWTKRQEKIARKQLEYLYITKNLSIKDISLILNLSQSGVFTRLKRLKILTIPEKKIHYLNKRVDIIIPQIYSSELAEFFGIMLGDGHISRFQVIVSLGTKEEVYAKYVSKIMKGLFGGVPKISMRKSDYKQKKYRDVYLGSIEIVSWLKKEGLVNNKVQSQVDVPKWIMKKKSFMMAFLRGFFDTDGSIYKLRYGIQVSFTNRSKPILISLQSMLRVLEYSPSAVSIHKIYITKREDVERFFREIKPKNIKHQERFEKFNASVV